MTVSLPLRMTMAPERCGGGAGVVELAAGERAEEALELAFVRGEDHGAVGVEP